MNRFTNDFESCIMVAMQTGALSPFLAKEKTRTHVFTAVKRGPVLALRRRTSACNIDDFSQQLRNAVVF